MPEAVKKLKRNRAIQFPQRETAPENITMTPTELQNVISAAIQATKKKRKPRPTNSLYRSDGIKKGTAADPIRSKEDFHKMVSYFGENGAMEHRLRNQTMFILGCGLGLRCGDLLSLRTSDVFTPSGEVKAHVELIEEKTRKHNICKIPEMAKDYLKRYLAEQKFHINEKTYLFPSIKGGHITVKRAYSILNEAGKACNIDGKISTHSMRKTYAVAALNSAENTVEAGKTVEMLQEKFKHADQRITMRYCKIEQGKVDEMSDRVSDWLGGK